MPNTVNVAEQDPSWMKSFSQAVSKEDFVQQLLKEGYTECLYLGLSGSESPTVGTFEEEYRLMGVWLFYKERFPLEEFRPEIQEETPVLIGMKLYAQMTSIGRGVANTSLNSSQLAEFMSFFRRRPEHWSETAKEEFAVVQYCWKT